MDDDADYFPSNAEEEQVFTTPLRLLQAIDLYTSRLQGSSNSQRGGGGGAAPDLLPGSSLGLSLPQLQAALRELREDVDAFGQAGDGDAC